MIRIENTNVVGWEAAIRGMRNPKNSWKLSDSKPDCGNGFIIGDNDLRLAETLAGAGNDHGKFLRMIIVTMDITAPLYWWKEFDTYKVGTVADSCSTMHKIQAKTFTLEDLSTEHLTAHAMRAIYLTIDVLNEYREKFLQTKDKNDWWQMIQLLPSSYNQRRTILLNYAVLRNQYAARKNHKLDEWREYCEWAERLPYAEELIAGTEK